MGPGQGWGLYGLGWESRDGACGEAFLGQSMTWGQPSLEKGRTWGRNGASGEVWPV